MDAVTVDGLKKLYNAFPAVDGISFSIKQGEIFGLLGPNGAGKTTTIKMLSGLTRPTDGTAKIMGRDILSSPVEVKKLIGVVPETSNLYPELTCLENLLFAGRLYGMRTRIAKQKADELLGAFGLSEKRNVVFGKLSGGMKRRLTMAASLVHDPPVLFLDEPTTGLDVMSARALRETMLSLKNRGITVLLTTHYIEEADRLCDRIAIVVKGKIAALGTPDALKRSIGAEKAVDIKVVPCGPPMEEKLRRLTVVEKIERRGEFFRCYAHDMDAFLSEFLAFAKDNALKMEDIHTVTPSLEDAFVEITGLQREAMIEEKAGTMK